MAKEFFLIANFKNANILEYVFVIEKTISKLYLTNQASYYILFL